ncbi:MAG: hypothetical protein IJR15_02690 [Clostridiales bacterium]|nr:hypothetical protein [Clostridiales bacterium]
MRKLRLLLAVIMASLFIFSGCEKLDPEMSLSVEGKTLTLDITVQEILDMGFNIGNINHKSGYMDPEDFPTIQARYLASDSYYILDENKDGLCLRISVYNPDSQDADLSQCKVYEYEYDVSEFYSDPNPDFPDVLLNEISVNFTDTEDVVNSFEAQGFKFDSDDSASFCEADVYGCSVLGADGLYGHTLTLFRDFNYGNNTVRASGFNITLKLDYDYA